MNNDPCPICGYEIGHDPNCWDHPEYVDPFNRKIMALEPDILKYIRELEEKEMRLEERDAELRAANETCERLRAELHAALNDLQARRLMNATMSVEEPPFPLTADINRAFAQEGD